MDRWELLSEREKDVATLSTLGLRDKDIADRLGVGLATVRTYWARIRFKLGLRSRAEMIRVALDHLPEADGPLKPRVERYQEISKVAGIALAVKKNGEWVFQVAGEGFAAIYGYSAAELDGMALRPLFAAEQWDVFETCIVDAEKARVMLCDVAHLTKTGGTAHGTMMISHEHEGGVEKLRMVHLPGIVRGSAARARVL